VLVASAERAARVLGWTAKRTALDAIVRDAWQMLGEPPDQGGARGAAQ
jgi:UDP-glucose 4-epimerase